MATRSIGLLSISNSCTRIRLILPSERAADETNNWSSTPALQLRRSRSRVAVADVAHAITRGIIDNWSDGAGC